MISCLIFSMMVFGVLGESRICNIDECVLTQVYIYHLTLCMKLSDILATKLL